MSLALDLPRSANTEGPHQAGISKSLRLEKAIVLGEYIAKRVFVGIVLGEEEDQFALGVRRHFLGLVMKSGTKYENVPIDKRRDMPVIGRRWEDHDVPLANRFQTFGKVVLECAPFQFCFGGTATLATTKIQIVSEGPYFCPEPPCHCAEMPQNWILLIKMQVRRPIQSKS